MRTPDPGTTASSRLSAQQASAGEVLASGGAAGRGEKGWGGVSPGFLPETLVDLRSKYVLRLYVTGHTANSLKAIANVKAVCDDCLADRYEMKVIDIYESPLLASEDQIVAVPTLVRVEPGPRRRLVGDMSDRMRVLVGLGLPPPGGSEEG